MRNYELEYGIETPMGGTDPDPEPRKYNDLKEPSAENSFRGVRYAAQYSDIIPIDRETYIIQGFPMCPECGAMLLRDFFKDLWRCSGCCTDWDRPSLIEALKNERAVAKLYEGGTDE